MSSRIPPKNWNFFSAHYFTPSRTITYRSFHIMSGCVCVVARSLARSLACWLALLYPRVPVFVPQYLLTFSIWIQFCIARSHNFRGFFRSLQTIPMCSYDYTYTYMNVGGWGFVSFRSIWCVLLLPLLLRLLLYLICCCLFVSFIHFVRKNRAKFAFI